MPERTIVRALKEWANTRGITCKTFSQDWIISIEDKAKKSLVYGYNFDLNSASASQIACDKAGLSDLLSDAGLPHVTHVLFTHPSLTGFASEADNWALASEIAQRHNFELVCKPNQGSSGLDVFRVRNERDMQQAMQLLNRTKTGICLCPFYEIDAEYRIILLNGRALLAYEKVIPTVTGNGGEHVPITWKHNLAGGATPRLLTETELSPLLPIARKALTIAGLQLAAIDIISTQGNLLILEVNCGIMLEHFAQNMAGGYDSACAVYDAILQEIFPY